MKYLFLLILTATLVSCANDTKTNKGVVIQSEKRDNNRECRVLFPTTSGGKDVIKSVWISPCIFVTGDTLKLVKQ